MRVMTKLQAILVFLIAASVNANDVPTHSLPAGYQPLHDVLDLPHFIPGMGEIHVVPGEINEKPWLGIDRNGVVVGATFIQHERLDEESAREVLAELLPDKIINHVDRQIAPPHQGQSKPHQHVTYWFVSHEEHLIYLK